MKTLNKRLPLLFTLLSILFYPMTGCEEKMEYQLLSGSLGGYVSAFTGSGITREGVSVTAYDGINSKTVVSDSNGFFLLEELQTGTYNILFEKDSFYTYKLISHQFVGGNRPTYLMGSIYLFKKNYAKIDSLILTVPDHFYDLYTNRIEIAIYASDVDSNNPFFRYYVSNSPDVSYINYMDTDTDPYYEIDTLAFPRGSDIYMIAYPCSTQAREYLDLETGQYIYGITTENASNVATYTVPETK